MIAEIIMHRMDWNEVWYADVPRRGWWRDAWRYLFKYDGRWHVGVWTGPQLDLICVRRCATNAEAERSLSPSGRTILSATLKALWRYWRTRKI